MAWSIRTIPLKDGESGTVNFDSDVVSVSTAVQGFEISYGNTDYWLRDMEVRSSIVSFQGRQVSVRATCKMHDKSNHIGRGTVTVVV